METFFEDCHASSFTEHRLEKGDVSPSSVVGRRKRRGRILQAWFLS